MFYIIYTTNLYKYFPFFSGGYSVDLHEWLSNDRLLNFLTPQQNVYWLITDRSSVRWSDPIHMKLTER